MSELQGARLPDAVWGTPGPGWEAWGIIDQRPAAAPGSYMKVDMDGRVEWWIVDPFGHVGRLTTHRVEEHEDGTITVTPSIFDKADTEAFRRAGGHAIIDPNLVDGWHGWLERGVWRQA